MLQAGPSMPDTARPSPPFPVGVSDRPLSDVADSPVPQAPQRGLAHRLTAGLRAIGLLPRTINRSARQEGFCEIDQDDISFTQTAAHAELASPVNQPPDVPADLLIFYVSADEHWAHWIYWQLQNAGHRCRLFPWKTQLPSPQDELVRAATEVKHLLVVYSDAWHKKALEPSEWLTSRIQGTARKAHDLVLLNVSERVADGPLAQVPRITLFGQPLLGARKRLLDGVGSLSPVGPEERSCDLPHAELSPAFPGDLPPVWTIPHPINPHFAGRDDELEQLRALISRWGMVVVSQSTSLGGAGKTQLATEYAWRYRKHYDQVLWVCGASRELLLANLSAMAGRRALNLSVKHAPAQATRIKAVLAAFRNLPRALVIFNGVDKEDLLHELKRLLHHEIRCHVLVTSRAATPLMGFGRLEVSALPAESATAFLQQRHGVDPSHCPSIAEAMGHWPLALELAGAHLRTSGMSPGDFLEALERIPDGRTDPIAIATAPLHPVNRVIELSRIRLTPVASAMLGLISRFEAVPIARELLGASAELVRDLIKLQFDERGESSDVRPATIDDAIGELSQLSLVWATPWLVSCHPIIQEHIRERMSLEHAATWTRLTLRWLEAHLPQSHDDPATWERWEQIRPHLRHALRGEIDRDAADLAASLAIRLANYLQARQLMTLAEPLYQFAVDTITGHFGADDPRLADALAEFSGWCAKMNRHGNAQLLLRQALEITTRAFGLEHRNTINRMSALATLLFSAELFDDAEPLFRRVLLLTRKKMGADHALSATAMANLAELLRVTLKHKESEALFRKALEIDQMILGPDHMHVARDLYGLAEVLRITGRKSETEPLYQRALQIEERHVGAEHPRLIPRLTRFAEIVEGAHRYAEAESLYRRLVHILDRHVGADHLDTASALNSLGVVLAAMHKMQEAESAYRRSLAIAEPVLGGEHPNLAACLNNLAGLFHTTNRMAEAELMYRRVLGIFQQALSPYDPALATVCSNLAAILTATNHVTEAEQFSRRALEIDEHVHGPSHPAVAIRLNNLAALLEDTNRSKEAELLYRRALSIDTQYCSPSDPAIGRDMNNLGSVLRAQGRIEEAQWFFERALAIEEKVFGPEHPNVAGRLNNLAETLKARGHLRQAEPMYRRVIHIFEMHHGPDHPSVAIAMNNLAELLKATKRHGEAEPLCRRALEIDQKNLGPEHPRIAIRLNNLAGLLSATDRRFEAEPLFRQAIAILRNFNKATGHRHSALADIQRKYISMLLHAGITEEESARRAGVAIIELQNQHKRPPTSA